MNHVFQWLSGAPCTDAQQADVDATVCASDLARAAFPHLRVAMLMPLVLLVPVPPPVFLQVFLPVPSLANHETGGQENHDDCDTSDTSDTSEAGSFQMCDPSDVFVKSTTFAVVDLSSYTLESCAKQGLVLACKWVFAATGRVWNNGVMRGAASHGQLKFGKWAKAEGCDFNEDVMSEAALGGHLEFAQWARAEGCDFGYGVMWAAAHHGQLEFAKWAIAEGCEWGSGVMLKAAGGGALEFAKWAHASGCKWTFDVRLYALRGGHMEFLQWARSEGCPE